MRIDSAPLSAHGIADADRTSLAEVRAFKQQVKVAAKADKTS